MRRGRGVSKNTIRPISEPLDDLLKTLIKSGEKPTIFIADIKEVKETGNEIFITLHKQGDDPDVFIYGARLSLDFDKNKSSYILPKEGSRCVAELVDGIYFIKYISVTDLINISNENESLYDILFDLLSALELANATSPCGPTSLFTNVADFTAIKLRLETLLVK